MGGKRGVVHKIQKRNNEESEIAFNGILSSTLLTEETAGGNFIDTSPFPTYTNKIVA
jgi:hypothetical protein